MPIIDISLESQSIRLGSVDIYLTRTEYLTMSTILLGGSAGSDIPKICTVLGYQDTRRSRSIVTTHISNIRKKLENLSEIITLNWIDDKQIYLLNVLMH